MHTRHWTQTVAAIGFAAIVASVATPALSAPVPSGTVSLKSLVASDVTDVRWRGRRGFGGAGIGAGIATGLLLGGVMAASPYYYGGPPVYYDAPGYYYAPGYGGSPNDAYCFSRYRSYDPASGTYMGYDGRRHPCM
jgi:hypothetical protein